jgi:Uncharacterized anaerobic dehydrogenase
MNTGRRLVDRLAARLGGSVAPTEFRSDATFGPMPAGGVPEKWIATTCGYCSVGCGMLVGVRDGAAVAVRGDPNHPVNRGHLCPKGLSEHLTLRADGRLTTPMMRADRSALHEPVSWDAALARVAHDFTALLDEYGPESVAVLSTGQLVTEEFYALGKLVRLGLGLSHYDGNTTLCMASAVSGYKATFGSDGPPGCYEDFETADVVILWGANIADNHPLLVPRVLNNTEAVTVVVDPRVTKTAMIAGHHYAVRPRGDVALLNGVLRVLVEDDLVDHEYVRAHTTGYDELVAHVLSIPLAEAERGSGISVFEIKTLARLVGHADRCVLAWTMGVNHSAQGTDTVTLLNTVAAITGNIGKPGAAPFSITGQCNAMGTRETGFTGSMPGYRAYDDSDARAELATLWGIDESRLPTARGHAYPDIMDAVVRGEIRALWIIGTNPVVSYPNRALVEAALEGLDLLVVQDGFETPTTAFADVVLPAAIWGEKEGTFTNSERRVSRLRAAVTPIGDARPDFDIFLALAEHLGRRDELFPNWVEPRDAFDEWRRVSAGRLCDYSGITYERIDEAGGVQWPCPGVDSDTGLETPLGGTPRLYANGEFASGRARLAVVESMPMAEPPDSEFPMVLNTGRTVEHWHTRTKTGRVGVLEALAPEAWIDLNPDDAATLRLRTGDRARVVSARGAIDRLSVRVTETVRAGEVFVPFHYDEHCANRLTNNEFDPVSREPNYKQCAVRVESA